MTERTFETHAPYYWAAGLPVIPLRPCSKIPRPVGWQEFCSRMPNDDEQAAWLSAHPSGNIGLPLGPESGLCMIDIDTEDEDLIDALLDVLPKSPWKRVGKKGMALAYRYDGQANFKLKDPDGNMALELLGLGNQLALPPSIHPDTRQPYTANANLWDVLDDVPALPGDIRSQLEVVLGIKNTPNTTRRNRSRISEGSRHDALVRECGRLRGYGLKGEQLRAALHAFNQENCDPPQDDGDVDRIASDATDKWSGGDGLPYTDQANGQRLVAHTAGRAVFVPERNGWAVWNNSVWQEDGDGQINREVKALASKMLTDAGNDKEARKAALALQSVKGASNAIKMAQSEAGVAVSLNEFDADPLLLNTQSGIVDLRDGTLSPADPAALHSKITGAPFNPNAEGPTFLRFLEDIFPSRHIREFAQRYFGYCATGLMDPQVFLIALGAGANGKSTLLSVIEKALGTYSVSTPMATFLQASKAGATPDLVDLRGARLTLASEGNPGQVLDSALIKRLSGGDTMTARRLYENHIRFRPTSKQVLVSNHLPTFDANDYALMRRVLILPFERKFADDERDGRMPAKLEAELEFVLRWLVAGASRFLRDGLEPPAEVTEAVAAYRAEMDVVASFIDECCIVNPNAEISASQLYREFDTFVQESGLRGMSQYAFGTALSQKGFEKRRSNIVYRLGLSLKPLLAEGRAVA